jgi:hypothetical protein
VLLLPGASTGRKAACVPIEKFRILLIKRAKKLLAEFPLQKVVYDRGGTPRANACLQAVGTHRRTADAGTSIKLDADTDSPVEIKFVALNGNGVKTSNENDLSVVAVIHFGKFGAEIGGDLSGYKTGSYDDIETSVAPKVGQIEVYKVHHHCSQYSTNDTWLAATRPRVAVISAGDGNRYRHPKRQCLDRLHAAGVKTYWTEDGNGGTPTAGSDVVGRNIDVEIAPNNSVFTVTYAGSFTDTYPVWGATTPTEVGMPKYAWSKSAKVYHGANCKYVGNISPANLERGDTPPEGKAPHKCVKGGA